MKVIIVGGGQMGAYIATLLLKNDCSVIVIENREAVFAKLSKELSAGNILLGDGTNPTVLEAAGIAGADVVAAVSGTDETNLVVSTIAKFEFGVPRVIARVNNPKNVWLFTQNMGVDVALNQADLLAHMVVEDMDLKNMYTMLKVSHGTYSIAEVKVDEQSIAAGKPVRGLALPEKSVLIAITRGEEVIIPRGDTVVKGGDLVLVLADADSKISINQLCKPRG
jgi:trk system potassium uptake protein TrkA